MNLSSTAATYRNIIQDLTAISAQIETKQVRIQTAMEPFGTLLCSAFCKREDGHQMLGAGFNDEAGVMGYTSKRGNCFNTNKPAPNPFHSCGHAGHWEFRCPTTTNTQKKIIA